MLAWRLGPHGGGRVAYFARVRYDCARVGCADEEACHKGLESVGGMPVGGHSLPILSTIFGRCFGVLHDEPSFMQIGSYVSRIAVGRFTRKTSERAAFMVMMSALVFWLRALVALSVSRSLSELHVEKSGIESTSAGNGEKICRVCFVREERVETR